MIKKCFYKIKEKIFKYGEKWDALAPNENDAIEFAHKFINEEPKINGFTDTEYLLAMSGQSINDSLRSGSKQFFYLAEDIKNKYMLKNNIVVYRGVSSVPYKAMINNAKMIKGVDYFERGFLNTSIVKGKHIESEKQLRIFVPKGTTAFYVGNISNEEKIYYEVIIQMCARLKIISMDDQFINCVILGIY